VKPVLYLHLLNILVRKGTNNNSKEDVLAQWTSGGNKEDKLIVHSNIYHATELYI